jgi:hypothetical protein
VGRFFLSRFRTRLGMADACTRDTSLGTRRAEY